MAQMIDLYFKRDVLNTLVKTLDKKAAGGDTKAAKGISITVSVNDEGNDYGQNCSAIVAQTKEERDEKKDKFYVANGKTFWSNNGEFRPGFIPREETAPQNYPVDDSDLNDLPF